MGLNPALLRRLATRALAAVVLVGAVIAASLGLLPFAPEPRGPVVAAAPSQDPGTAAPATAAPATPGPTVTAESVATPSAPMSGIEWPSATIPATPGSPPAPSLDDPTRPLVAAPTAATPSANEATRRALTASLAGLRATYGLPGVSAAILFPDGTIWRATSGFADVRTRRHLTADTEFAVASISKTFLAALILKLVEEGKVGLDTPVVTYLPSLAIDPTITVRQLLDHTSGLHDFFYDPDIDEALLSDRTRVWTAEEALSYVGKPYFRPGEGWHYSNTNYVVLGLLAETTEGLPLAQQLHARFLTPLGLAHTHYQSVDPPAGPLARAYRFDGPGLRLKPIPLSDGTDVVPFTSVVTAAGSAGSIASTPTDLVKWARGLYGGTVLTPSSFVTMVTDAQRTIAFKPSVPYGLGVQEATIDGRPTLGHSGRFLGSRSVVRWLPNEGIAIAVLTNQSRNDPGLVARALLRVILGTPAPCTDCLPAVVAR